MHSNKYGTHYLYFICTNAQRDMKQNIRVRSMIWGVDNVERVKRLIWHCVGNVDRRSAWMVPERIEKREKKMGR